MPRIAACLLLVCAAFGAAAAPSPRQEAWQGVWTWDLCHEDRKPAHQKDTFCREGRDRIRIALGAAGRIDLTLCPEDPWNERDARLVENGQRLTFRSREGFDVRLVMGEDRAHFSGRFVSPDGHSGRIQGRRVPGCGSQPG